MSIAFERSNYPHRKYYYALQAGEYVETQKVILIK